MIVGGRRLDHMATFTDNTWGLAFNETGDVFGNTANGEHSNYVAIPRPYYQDVKGLSGDGKKKLDGHYAMHANTRRIRQVDVQGGFTAAAGHNFYTARAFPKEYWNRVAFVNEPTGHVVHRAIIERQGSGFVERDGWNVAASDDEWFAPVHAVLGNNDHDLLGVLPDRWEVEVDDVRFALVHDAGDRRGRAEPRCPSLLHISAPPRPY